MWFIYVIRNKARTFSYIGITEDVIARLKKHNEGATRSSRPYRPFDKILVLEKVRTRKLARQREKYYKSGMGRDEIKLLLEEQGFHGKK